MHTQFGLSIVCIHFTRARTVCGKRFMFSTRVDRGEEMYVNDFSMQQRQQLKLRQQPHERQMRRIEREIGFFLFIERRWNIKMQICILLLLLLLLDYSIVHIILVHILSRCATLSTGKYCCRCHSNRDIARDEMQACA